MHQPSPTALQVSILIFDDCDLLDTGGPYEVFLTANRLAKRGGGPAPFNVDVVSVSGEPVAAYGGLGLVPTAPPSILDQSDLVIVPGAVDLEAALADSPLLDVIRKSIDSANTNSGSDTGSGADANSEAGDAGQAHASGETIVASVCTGAFLLGAVGALEGREWTTHWEDIELLGQRIGAEGAANGVRWVDSGSIVTGGALSSGIAMALHLVARMASQELAESTAVQLDYDWTNTSIA